MERVYIGQTKNTGKGVFAKAHIKKGEVVFVFRGERVKYNSRPGYQVGQRWLGVGDRLWIKPSKDNPGYYINHSCQPNAGIKGTATIVAMRDIGKDEEVTIDYSTTEEDPTWKMRCNCGMDNCRKIIKSIQFLPEKLFNKYRSFIPRFFQQSYIRARNLNADRRNANRRRTPR